MRRTRRRWSDNERRLGPFTFSRDKFARLGAMLDCGDMEDGSASLRFHAAGCTFLVALPSIFPIGREYGAFAAESNVHIRYGRQTMDSSTEQSACWSIPWLTWRHVRHSIYGLRGEHIADEIERDWRKWFAVCDACPSESFDFDDFDGERIVATTRIEEHEWRLGTRWCKWLSIFRAPRISRSLDIRFSKETGPKKGSWKGGTVGHSIEMRPGELHESAFRRYCAEHQMRFVGQAVVSPEETEDAKGAQSA